MEKIAFCLFLLAACAPRAGAALAGGAFSVPFVASLSGGGPASGGAFSLAAVNLGGPSFSSAAPSGGLFSLASGGAPALLPSPVSASGDLAAAHCFPVPFRRSEGHTRITFTALTRSARVRIYTVSGELVRSLEKNDAGASLDWDLKNSRGEEVVSGVYVYTVKGAAGSASGKLMIIR